MDTKQLMEWSAKYHTPNYGRTPLVLVRGEGARVWDSDGKEYLDFTSGIAVTSLGHCHPVVTGAIREAAATLLHVSNIFHTRRRFTWPSCCSSTRLPTGVLL
jgi:acetylornithine aminotransferase/acetylornithine/N-succinyldiaminopimelate aminotransferase